MSERDRRVSKVERVWVLVGAIMAGAFGGLAGWYAHDGDRADAIGFGVFAFLLAVRVATGIGWAVRSEDA